MRRGFTLIELLLVIVIILTISVVALPTIIPAISHRQVSEGSRILQGALVGARDAAIHDNAPSGIRLLPDPTYNGVDPKTGHIDPSRPLAYNRAIPISQPPEYSEGLINIRHTAPPANISPAFPPNYPVADAGGNLHPYPIYGHATVNQAVLMVEESLTTNNIPNSPTTWFWNVRVGDRMQINGGGQWYTVVGPLTVGPAQGNSELFVNVGLSGVQSPLRRGQGPAEFLFLVDGRDDDGNGWVDEGWDGVDNNGDGLVDDLLEWEAEAWPHAYSVDRTDLIYVIQRRPAAAPNAREIVLPSSVVIDATTWGTTRERSRFPAAAFNPFTGEVDIVVNPSGEVVPTTIFSSPSSLGIDGAFFHFFLCERQDVNAPVGTVAPTLPVGSLAPTPVGEVPAAYGGPALKGEYRLSTLFARSGQLATNESALFDNPAQDAANNRPYNVNLPFTQAQQGVTSR